eukprot:6872367-Pyramimonas_sp.AAC.2
MTKGAQRTRAFLERYAGVTQVLRRCYSGVTQRGAIEATEAVRQLLEPRLAGDALTVELTVKTLLSHLITQEFNSPINCLRMAYVRVAKTERGGDCAATEVLEHPSWTIGAGGVLKQPKPLRKAAEWAHLLGVHFAAR